MCARRAPAHGPFVTGPAKFPTGRGRDVGKTEPMTSVTSAQLAEHLDHVAGAPADVGTVELVVARPAIGERTVLDRGELRPGVGLVGDNYLERGSGRPDGAPADPLAELNLMGARALEAVAGPDRANWPPAGDQLIVDFDLSERNCPAGTRLAVGTAVIEVTSKPHNGCAKFAERYGVDAARWVNSRKDLRLRGICAVVVGPGTVASGDAIRRI
jgi:hypothetical protein